MMRLFFINCFFVFFGWVIPISAQLSITPDGSSRSHDFKIITARDYCVFLNAVAQIDPHHLYDEKVESDPLAACIVRSGVSGHYHYDVIEGCEKFCVGYVNWLDEARYCNWLQNGEQSGKQGAESIENGVYALEEDDDDFYERLVSQSSEASYFLTDDEEDEFFHDDFLATLSSNKNNFSVVFADEALQLGLSQELTTEHDSQKDLPHLGEGSEYLVEHENSIEVGGIAGAVVGSLLGYYLFSLDDEDVLFQEEENSLEQQDEVLADQHQLEKNRENSSQKMIVPSSTEAGSSIINTISSSPEADKKMRAEARANYRAAVIADYHARQDVESEGSSNSNVISKKKKHVRFEDEKTNQLANPLG